ncbi:MAG: carbonic anhydrase [Phycisphaerales bacterium]|jgi:carbonic anhydrase
MNHLKFVIGCIVIFVGASIATQDEFSEVGDSKGISLIVNNLLEGNARYVSGNMTSRNLPEDRESLAAGQSPDVVVIRCADSRVAPEIVFDQQLGSLFVCGVAGNVPTPEIIGSIEYAVAVLGSRVIVVMGHSSCGAVSAAMGDTSELPQPLRLLIGQVQLPSVKQHPNYTLSDAIVCNAQHGIQALLTGSEVIANAVEAGELKIISGVQDLASGKFTIIK